MKLKLKFVVFLILFAIAACSPIKPQCPALSTEGLEQLSSEQRNTVLANRYEVLYKQYSAKAEEHKKHLEHFEDKRQYYGKQGLDLPGHLTANIRYYENLAQSANELMKKHRELSQE